MIGRQVREKGICEYLEAACEVSKVNSEIFFLLVGERLSSDHATDVSNEISIAIEVLGDRLIILGPREDIPEVLKAMDVFCLPSWREGMPRTIIEAMMMAKPVIATNIRGSREEVLSGKTGILVPVKSPRELAQAILLLASNLDKCISYGKAGRDRAISLYEESRVVALQIDRLKADFQAFNES
jgi:glycosyltransferase involved in cell wall biosynthesis